MHLTVQTDYALRILMYAAARARQAPTARFSVEEVAAAYGISRNHVMKIVQRLAGVGYLASYRGRKGGLELGVAPESLKLGTLIHFLEGDFALVSCQGSASTCVISGCCGLQGALGDALEAFLASLNTKTLADVALGHPALRRLGIPEAA